MFILSNVHTFLFIASAQAVLIACVFQMHVLPLFQKQADIESFLLNERNTKEIVVSPTSTAYESCYHYEVVSERTPSRFYPVLFLLKYQLAVYKAPSTEDGPDYQLFSRPPPEV